MPLQHSNMPEGILLELNDNNKSQRQDGECDFVCLCVSLEVLKMGRQVVASVSLKLFFAVVHITL